MKGEKLIIKIKKDGTVEAETIGIMGEKCLNYMDPISKLINGKIVDSRFTKDFYGTEDVSEEEMNNIKPIEEIRNRL